MFKKGERKCFCDHYLHRTQCHIVVQNVKKKHDVALPILTYLIFAVLVAVAATLLRLPSV